MPLKAAVTTTGASSSQEDTSMADITADSDMVTIGQLRSVVS